MLVKGLYIRKLGKGYNIIKNKIIVHTITIICYFIILYTYFRVIRFNKF